MNLNQVCRACLVSICNSIHDLNDSEVNTQYRMCTTILVAKDDSLPTHLCDTCFQLVHTFCEFREKCLATEAYLENSLNSSLVTNELFKDCLANPLIVEDVDYQEDNYFCSEDNKGIDEVEEETIKKEAIELEQQKLNRNLIKQTHAKSCENKWSPKLRKFTDTNKPPACETCNKTFKSIYNLTKHISVYHTITSLESMTCPKCGRVFNSSTIMRRHHKLKHEGIGSSPVVCHVCGNKFNCKNSLKNHLETHSGPSERIHRCERCGRSYMTAVHLALHLSRAHSGRRYVCETCGREFATRNTITQHVRSHMGIKRYSCNVCGKSYAHASFMKEHIRTHTGERPFHCSTCRKSFISRRGLVEHQRIHSGDKRYQCNVCNMAFIQRGSLNRHTKIHNKKTAETLLQLPQG